MLSIHGVAYRAHLRAKQSNATADSCANEGLKSMCEYSNDGADSGAASHRGDALSPLLIQSPPPAPSPFRWRASMRCGHDGRREAFATVQPLFAVLLCAFSQHSAQPREALPARTESRLQAAARGITPRSRFRLKPGLRAPDATRTEFRLQAAARGITPRSRFRLKPGLQTPDAAL